MKTTLASKLVVLPWMHGENRKFRAKFPVSLESLPLHSKSLDRKTFKIDGCIVGDNVGSAVGRVSDKNGTYIVKSKLKSESLLAEAAFLNKWNKVGANAVKVIEVIKPTRKFPHAMAILEHIPSLISEEEASKNKVALAPVYKRLGKGLALVHKAHGKRFGPVKDPVKLIGRYSTFKEETFSVLKPERLKELLSKKLIAKKDLDLLNKAVEIVEKDFKTGTKPTLIHDDIGLFNTFGIHKIKFFDPDPVISHPLRDVSMALIWATFEKQPQKMRKALLQGYKSKVKFNEQVLNACMFIKILQKWEWWLIRGRGEKKVITWITKTKGLFKEARQKLMIEFNK